MKSYGELLAETPAEFREAVRHELFNAYPLAKNFRDAVQRVICAQFGDVERNKARAVARLAISAGDEMLAGRALVFLGALPVSKRLRRRKKEPQSVNSDENKNTGLETTT